MVRNPFNANQLSKLKLDGESVDAIVFWTKNARPMLDRLHMIDELGIPYYFQFTITPYGKDAEPGLPSSKTPLIDTFKVLSQKLGPDRVIWRYDPIFLDDDKYSLDFHKRAFERCAGLLTGSTNRAVISFLDMDYNNTKSINSMGVRDGSDEEKNALAAFMASIAEECGISLETCAEGIDLEALGIRHGCCIDADLIEKISGRIIIPKWRKKDSAQRPLCGCISSYDIGAYNTCLHGCSYCYANYAKNAIRTNFEKHDPNSPVLIGECDADAVQFRKSQTSVFSADERPRQESLF